MYELFILGKLLDMPMHGYMLHQIVQAVIGPTRQMSWGALYPLIRRLEADGLIGADESSAARRGGRARKMYRITERGRLRLIALMEKSSPYDSDYLDTFSIKLSNFHHVTHAQQGVILDEYARYVLFVTDYLVICRQRVAKEDAISERARGSILRAIDHRMHLMQADQAWIIREIALLNGQPDSTRASGGMHTIETAGKE